MITQNLEFNRNCGSETQDHDKIRLFPLNKTGTKPVGERAISYLSAECVLGVWLY